MKIWMTLGTESRPNYLLDICKRISLYFFLYSRTFTNIFRYFINFKSNYSKI